MTALHVQTNRPVGIDLFAGAGGLSLGFEQAGFDIAAAIEIDPIHCAVHEYNFPRTKTICASVVDLSGTRIRESSGLGEQQIDVVFGGAPCQGFSMIGKRVLDDPRNHLVTHFVRLVSELQPRYCVFENVRGLTLGTHVRFLEELIDALVTAGYQVTLPYEVLNAANYGVPQDRKRLFLLAAHSDQRLAQYPEPTATRVTVGEAIADLPDAEQFTQLQSEDQVAVQWPSTSSYARTMRCLENDVKDFGYQRGFDRDLLTSSLRTEHTDLSKQRFAATTPGDTEPVSRFRRLPADGLCHTLRAGTDSARGAFTSPRPIHPYQARVITVREAARLHSYPDWFRFHCTKWHGFRQIGNSVPPRLARAVAGAIMRALGKLPVKPVETLFTGNLKLLQLDMSAAARYFRVPYDTIAQRQRATNPAQLDLWGTAYEKHYQLVPARAISAAELQLYRQTSTPAN